MANSAGVTTRVWFRLTWAPLTVLPSNEQVPGLVPTRYPPAPTWWVAAVPKGPSIVVSRSHPNWFCLFRHEVPRFLRPGFRAPIA